MIKLKLILPIVAQLVTAQYLFSQGAGIETPEPMLRAGVCRINITPPLTIPLGGYTNRTGPATGIRDSLYATAIVFDDGETKAAIVTLDIIQAKYKEGQQIYRAIESEADIAESNVIINASHTHGSPWLETDSYFKEEVIKEVAKAVKTASLSLDTISVGYGEGEVGFNVSRRKITGSGQYITALNPDGLTDHRVKVLRVDCINVPYTPKAIIFHVVCHPNVFRWKNTRVTADFPGEAKSFIEKNFSDGTTALFLQGCAGDIRANLPEEGKGPDESSFGRNGDEADMRWCGWSAGAEVVKISVWLGVKEQIQQRREINKVCTVSGLIKVSAKEKEGNVLWPREHIVNGKAHLPVKMISIGKICFVALPGEPVVEYGFIIEEQLQSLGFNHVFVMGYSDGDAGYIPTKKMFSEGGYEVTESALLPSCEKEIIKGIKRLAKDLIKQAG